VLTTDSVTPVVTDTSVTTDLLHSLNVVTDTGDEVVDGKVHGLAGGEVLLSVDEPVGHLELLRVHDDGDKLLHLLRGKGTGATVDVDLGLLAHKVGVSLANTTDLGHGEHALPLTLNVRVHHTEDVLELGGHLQTL